MSEYKNGGTVYFGHVKWDQRVPGCEYIIPYALAERLKKIVEEVDSTDEDVLD